MITHTSDAHQIPSQNKTKSKLQILRNCKNSNCDILREALHATHLLKLLDKVYKYEMDPTRTVGATERTRDAGRTDGQTDGRSETDIPPTTLLCGGYKKPAPLKFEAKHILQQEKEFLKTVCKRLAILPSLRFNNHVRWKHCIHLSSESQHMQYQSWEMI